MKVLFLDVDGVLNSFRSCEAFGGFPFPECKDPKNPHYEMNQDPIAVALIRRLCKETGAVIVMHSSWRNYCDPIDFGVRWDIPIVDYTERNIDKSKSIRRWLKKHPEVTIYAIVDDDDMGDKEHQRETATYDGLKFKDYERLKMMLRQKEKE